MQISPWKGRELGWVVRDPDHAEGTQVGTVLKSQGRLLLLWGESILLSLLASKWC